MRHAVVGSLLALVLAGCSGGAGPIRAKAVRSTPEPSAPATAAPTSEPRKVKAAAASLERFDSCGDMLTYVKAEALKAVGPYGLPGGPARLLGDVILAPEAMAARDTASGASPAALPATDQAYSGTNVQEEGVDEPDVAKTDGKRIFTVRQNRVYAVDVTGGAPRVVGSLDLGQTWGAELLLHRDRLLAFTTASASGDGAAELVSHRGVALRTTVTTIDVRDPAGMQTVSKLDVDGSYVSARLAGGVVRMVLRSAQPSQIAFSFPKAGDPQALEDAKRENREAIERSAIGDWLPRYTLETGGKVVASGHAAACASTYRPSGFSGFGMTSVLTIDPADPQPREAASVAADADIVYASPKTLYVATNRWSVGPVAVDVAAGAAPEPTDLSKTEIHAFDITDAKQARYVASGSVRGHLLNQWSMSEHDGRLRVASTLDPVAPATQTQSRVVVLERRDDALVEIGSVGGLGKGERIYAVRFMGPLGYVVTFRQVDPLYVLDLRDAVHPKVTGELKIPGFSAYLHPVGDGYLLGVGQDATDEGRVQGTQVSLFDVRDPAKPSRLHQVRIGGHSEAESDHKAFLYWARSKLAVMPVGIWIREDGGAPFSGAIALTVDPASGISERGRISHVRDGAREPGSEPDVMPIRRSIVVGSTLYTVSESGVLGSDLGSLEERGWVALTA